MSADLDILERNVHEARLRLSQALGALAADAAKPDKPGKSSKSDRSANQSKSKAKSSRSLRDMAKTAKAKADAEKEAADAAAEEGRSLEVMVQVNTSGEESKSGLAPEQLPELLSELEQFETLRVTGLMTIAMDSEDEQRVRGCFRLLRQLRDRAREDGPGFVGDGELSMGMSGDLELAIAEGATCVRAGRAIFGQRPRP